MDGAGGSAPDPCGIRAESCVIHCRNRPKPARGGEEEAPNVDSRVSRLVEIGDEQTSGGHQIGDRYVTGSVSSGTLWLWVDVRSSKKESDYFLVLSRTYIDCAMDAIFWFVPICQPGVYGKLQSLTSIAELYAKLVTLHDYRESVTQVGMPRHNLARLQDQPSYQ
jgi:hypothetical protein